MIIMPTGKAAFRALSLVLMMGLSVPVVIAEPAEPAGIHYERGERRDPLIPLIGPDGKIAIASKGPSLKDFVIEGIIYDREGQSVVVIEGDLYKAGDSLFGANIVAIHQDRIVLVLEDEQKTYWLREEIFNF